MDNNTVETCAGIIAIALIATVGPKFGLSEGLAGTAIAAIAGLVGRGIVQMGKADVKQLESKPLA